MWLFFPEIIPVQEITFVMHDNFDANFLNTEK